MKTHLWLTFTKSGIAKTTKEKPKLGVGQRAVRLTISVPDSAFSAPPDLDAELTVPADRLAYPDPSPPIDVEIWE